MKDETLVEFIAAEEGLYGDPDTHPYPAHKNMPVWYKKMEDTLSYERYVELHKDDNIPKTKMAHQVSSPGTVRACIPFRDFITAGYIIPLWADTFFEYSPDHDNMQHHDMITGESIGVHLNWQVDKMFNYRWIKDNYYKNGLKFLNPWIIITPPGYSCMFLHPINYMDDSFITLQAVVDTDNYRSRINFPFLYNKNYQLHKLNKGTPIVHVIPFKREHYKHTVSDKRPDSEKDERGIVFRLTSMAKHRYRDLFWSKDKLRYK